jgi:hypothetical protein
LYPRTYNQNPTGLSIEDYWLNWIKFIAKSWQGRSLEDAAAKARQNLADGD